MVLQAAISSSAPALGGLSSIGSSFPYGALIGGITSGVGIIANALSSRKAFRRQKELMQLQADLNYRYNRDQTINQYSWQRRGLTNAGYNPLLALQGAAGPSAQSWAGSPSSPQADFTGFASDFANATDKMLSQQRYKAELDNLNSQTTLNSSNQRLNTERGLNLMADTDLKTTQNEIEKIERDNRSNLLNSQIHKNLVSARSDMLNAIANQTSANASQISANAQRIKADSDVNYQNNLIKQIKTNMNLTKSQTEQIRQIMKWYGAEHGVQLVRDLAAAGYLGSGAVRNLNNIKNDDINTLKGLLPLP